MTNSDNDPRRDSGRPENNPFIAFRRFADSQVSSLLNTVFTLPATIANYNNAHQAREECLFGKADKQKCEKLRELEEEIAGLRHEGREFFRVGDVQNVLRTSEELMKLDRSADDLRKSIVDDTVRDNSMRSDACHDASVMERVANRKGQEWGWMWDWGFPRPFDCENQTRNTSETDRIDEMREWEAMLRLQSEVQRMVADFDGETWDDRMRRKVDADADSREPRVWTRSWSWQRPPPADAEKDAYSPRALEQDSNLKRTGVPWRDAYEDLLREEREDTSQSMHDEPSYEYGHDHEDQHDDPPTPKPKFSSRPTFTYKHIFPFAEPPNREEMDTRSNDDPQHQTIPETQQQHSLDYKAQLKEDGAKHNATWSYEADEEGKEETEMEAYEQLGLNPTRTMASPDIPFSQGQQGKTESSILSTLTTTERVVALDGSVTTKTVLKKRFADGREESSETVHTSHSQDTGVRQQDMQHAAQNLSAPVDAHADKKANTKRPSWFWSS